LAVVTTSDWIALAGAVSTVALAIAAFLQLRRSAGDRQVIELQANAAIASYRHENLPELVAYDQLDAGYRQIRVGEHAVRRPRGGVRVAAEITADKFPIVSFEVQNIGRGAGRIIEARVLGYDISLRGDQRVAWEPAEVDRVTPIVVPPGGTTSIDLILASRPGWFDRHVMSDEDFWVEVEYVDLADAERVARFFELRKGPDLSDESGGWHVIRTWPEDPRLPQRPAPPFH
jgi:hypothetical protein